MQHEMRIGPMPVAETRSADMGAVASMTDPQQAIDLSQTMARPRRSIRDIRHQPGYASLLECSAGEVSKRLNSRWADSLRQIVAWEEVTHTRVITQFMAYSRGGLWVPRELSEAERQQRRICELEEELAAAKRGAA